MSEWRKIQFSPSLDDSPTDTWVGRDNRESIAHIG